MILLSVSFVAHGQSVADLDKQRMDLIVKAFNQKPDSLIEPLVASDVKIRDGVGRVDVNKKAKFSYYIQTESPQDPNSRIVLIPMATSRFTPTYYQTDEWWDAHKNEKPMPRQPMEEVMQWLQDMKLTTNPDVLTITPENGQTQRQPLQDFLFDFYLQKYAHNGVITLYRGAERPDETQKWEQGERPSGVRYWTPTANYAWRYARKNQNLISDLVLGQAPILKFEVPVEIFRDMVQRRWQRLTLGTELTKRVHDMFDSTGRFQDQLTSGYDYLGEGTFGVEFELRSNKAGADEMARHYKGTVQIEELAKDRIKVILEALKRLKKQRPPEAAKLEKQMSERIEQIRLEARLLTLVQKKGSSEEIKALLAKLLSKGELTNVDGFNFQSYVQQKLNEGGFDQKEPAKLSASGARAMMCGKVHR
jgi:hypothetical protein